MRIHKVQSTDINGNPIEFELALFEIGETVYYPFDRYRVVKATITGLENVYTVPGLKSGVWEYINKDGVSVSIPTSDTDEKGWTIYRHENKPPDNAKLVNQFVCIDEPIGHSIQYYPGSPSASDFFPTLEEALRYICPSKRNKRPRVKLKQYRRDAANFIGQTHTNNGLRWESPFKNLPDKKVYVRRG